MRRSFLVSGGVLTGIASVLGLNPLHTGVATAAVPTSNMALPAKTVPATTAVSAAVRTRTITGSPVNFQYGTVQVQLKVRGKQITAVNVLQAPTGRSQQFSNYAIPTLKAEVLQAQSAKVAMVSGATYTSMGFLKSLSSAFKQV